MSCSRTFEHRFSEHLLAWVLSLADLLEASQMWWTEGASLRIMCAVGLCLLLSLGSCHKQRNTRGKCVLSEMWEGRTERMNLAWPSRKDKSPDNKKHIFCRDWKQTAREHRFSGCLYSSHFPWKQETSVFLSSVPNLLPHFQYTAVYK